MSIGWDDSWKKKLGGCGENVYIGHNVIFTNPSQVFLGDRVRIDPFSLITTGLKTGNNIQICSHVVLSGGGKHTITLGDWCFIGYGSKFFCGSEDYSGEQGPVNEYWGNNKVYHGDIELNSYSGVASDVIVMPGVTLPEGTTIGLKSVVWKKDLLNPYSVYVGHPLTFLKDRNQEAIQRLSKDEKWLKHV